MYISIGKVSFMLGVSKSSLRRWDLCGYLKADFKTMGGHRRYLLSKILEICGKSRPKSDVVLGYARVSGHKQKVDLDHQKKSIKNYADLHRMKLERIYSDIASGLNDQRPNFLRLKIPEIRPKAVIITYRDRLARFGLEVIKLFCKIFSCELVSIFQPKSKNLEQELAEGVIAVITSYAGRFHRKRRGTLI